MNQPLGFAAPKPRDRPVPDQSTTAAGPAARPPIRESVFTGGECPPGSAAFTGCFPTMEHAPDPRGRVEQSFQMLQPGGIPLTVNAHNVLTVAQKPG